MQLRYNQVKSMISKKKEVVIFFSIYNFIASTTNFFIWCHRSANLQMMPELLNFGPSNILDVAYRKYEYILKKANCLEYSFLKSFLYDSAYKNKVPKSRNSLAFLNLNTLIVYKVLEPKIYFWTYLLGALAGFIFEKYRLEQEEEIVKQFFNRRNFEALGALAKIYAYIFFFTYVIGVLL